MTSSFSRRPRLGLVESCSPVCPLSLGGLSWINTKERFEAVVHVLLNVAMKE
jgi:hypothetical protein